MDFSFSEEQNLLRNSVQGFLTSAYDFDTRRKVGQSDEGMRREIWKQFADLGLLGLPFAEKYGGLGEGASHIETMIIMEEFGRFLVTEPYVPTVVLAGGLLRHASAAQQDEYLPALTQGEALWALAAHEPNGRFFLNHVETSASKQGGGYILTGHKAAVAGGAWADYFIVSARTSGGADDKSGISLFVVDRKASGVDVHDYRSVDGSRVAELMLKDSPAVLLGNEGEGEGEGFALLDRAADEGIAALCAEACGAMKELHTATMEYCKTRKQFGVPIGTFQVLQHRMVDMFIAYEQAVSMAYMASLKLGEGDEDRARAVSAAKAQICRSARFVGQSAVQLHGGMGMSDELNVGHFFKRLSIINALYGNEDFHVDRYIALT